MRTLRPAFIVLALCAAICSAQEPQPIQADSSDGLGESSPLDFKFDIGPVELDISEELTKAKQNYEAGEWQQAIDAATGFLDENPQHKQSAAALFLRGESSVQLERYEDVLRDFKLLLKSNPNPTQRIRAEFRIAEASMLSSNWIEAQRRFEEFRQQYPNDELNAYVIAYLAETIGRDNIPSAKALYLESIQKYPQGPLNRRARLHLALIRFSESDLDLARKELAELVETGDRSTAEFWTAWYWLARAELRAGQTDAAIERFLAFTEEYPKHEFAAAAMFQAADAYHKSDQTQQALDLYQQVRADWPDSKYAAASLVGEMQTLKQQGQLKTALNRFTELQRDVSPYLTLQATQLATEILLANKKYKEAEELIQPFADTPTSLQADDDRVNHYTNLYLLALAKRGQGKYSSANELLGRIRPELVSSELAQRVMLARVETSVALKDYDEATQSAFRFEARYPTSQLLPAVRAQMVRGLVALKRFDEANVKLDQLKSTSDAEIYITRAAEVIAESAYQRGDYTTARAAFETLEQYQQSDDALARALSGLAWIDRKLGNPAEAAKRFGNFIEAFPNHPTIWQIRLAYADALSELGKNSKAIRALEPFESLPKSHPLRPRGLYRLADLASNELGQQARAAEIVDLLLTDYPDFEQQDAALYLAATLHQRAGDPAAETTFKEIVEHHATSRYWSDALYRLAELAYANRDNKHAQRYLTRLISAERDLSVVPHALFMKGRLESDEKNWTQARGTLRELLKTYPDSNLVPVARYGVAESFFQEKEFDRAYQLFQILDREQRFQPGDAWGAMVRLRNAQLEVQRKNLVRATEIAESIERDYPEFSLQHEVDYLIGRVAAARGEFSKARAAYHKVVAADATYEREISAMAQWMIGESYFHQKQYILAIKAYEALVADLRFENWQAASHLQIGKCYELLENFEQAKTSYARVTTRYGDSKWVDEAKYRLDSLNMTE